ncbi:helix-turn-helix domain-containing protein [Gordonia sp. ABSL11-1]|uniref:helix-turn-helix domain-containing protein n=1 Tax=Gordonia sp. ABSL11-1 TaxID=3053924 RepID=UPI002572319B|nr:helix-turn-helix domain-containing protein [Gordonia sp. ABSL11-1]MDL9946978.1 helix-turn-helix domain-containing protein [Gordonia sp. ABSL11-1]
MKPDRSGSAGTRIDDVERAHLVDPADTSFSIGRWAPSPDLTDLVRRFWVPTWSVPPGTSAPQRVLQYPVCLIVVTGDYSRFYGPTSGLSETELTGDGWAIGTMLAPAAGSVITGGPVAEWTDRHDDLSVVAGGRSLTADIRTLMATDPHDPSAQHEATDLVEAWIRPLLPADDDGMLINAIVEFVENDSTVTSVTQICDRFHVTERTLQRLTQRRLGLTPKWLIQRRRLHEAAERLRGPDTTLAMIAAELGYADEAHLVRDFRTVTGLTPGRFAARFDQA